MYYCYNKHLSYCDQNLFLMGKQQWLQYRWPASTKQLIKLTEVFSLIIILHYYLVGRPIIIFHTTDDLYHT